ncbi:MAG TPA: hypothetical protein VF708_20505 [Pyrinomonadaceae bacterium]|jgi:hypothetical protein
MITLSHQRKINFKRIFIFAATIIVTTILGTHPGITQQGQERLLKKESWPKEPVKIVGVKAAKKSLKLNEKFLADDDWFKGFTVRLINTSGKNITYISLRLLFARPEDGETAKDPPYVYSLTYGRDPSLPKPSTTSNSPQTVLAGKSIDIALPDEWYDSLKQGLKELKYPASIKRMEIALEEVAFEDGTMWSAGQFWQRDPNNSDKWVPIGQSISRVLNHPAKFLGNTP